MKYPQIIAAIQNRQWAMTEDAMNGLLRAIESGIGDEDYNLFHGAAIGDIDAITEDLGNPPPSDPENEYVRILGSIGTLLIDGPIVPRSRRSWKVSGINSTQQLAANFKMLDSDPSIKDIVLFMDTPGGSVTGLSDFAAQVAKSEKKVTAYVFGMAASAGYYIASQADRIVSADSGMVGSIGTVATFKKKQDGVIDIVSRQSPNKRLDAETPEGKERIQVVLSDLADLFIDAAASGRGVSREKVLADFGQGDMMVAARAKDAGMIDDIMMLGDFMKSLEEGTGSHAASGNIFQSATVDTQPNNKLPAKAGSPEEVSAMNLTEAIAQNPALKQEIEALEAKAFEAGAASEQEKIEARVATAKPFLGNSKYAEANDICVQVILGEEPPGTLKACVMMLDKFSEKGKSETVKTETEEIDDAGGTPTVDPSGQGTQVANADARVANIKKFL